MRAEIFRIAFAGALLPYSRRVAVLIFEFGAFANLRLEEFLFSIEAFLAKLPEGFRYGVEVRNPEILGPDYFRILARHRVAHVFNAWTRMPELSAQIVLPHAFTADFFVVRALLRQGRPYERAVEMFSLMTPRGIRTPRAGKRSSTSYSFGSQWSPANVAFDSSHVLYFDANWPPSTIKVVPVM